MFADMTKKMSRKNKRNGLNFCTGATDCPSLHRILQVQRKKR